MAQPQFTQLQFGFDVRTDAPVDRRLVLTAEQMKSGVVSWNGLDIKLDNILPEDYVALCSNNGLLYVYDKLNKRKLDDPYRLGKFKLLTRVMDIVNSEGDTVTDSEGLVVAYDIDGKKLKVAEKKVAELDETVSIMKGDGEPKEKLNKEDVFDILEQEFEKKGLQQKMTIYGTADLLTSEGVPFANPDTGVSGVHVTYEKYDKKTGPTQVLISHEEKVGGNGWKSLFQCGGVPVNRFFPADTTIKEIVRLMLVGDPMFDNAIYYGAIDYKPSDMAKDIIGKLTFGTASKRLSPVDGHEMTLYEEMIDNWSPEALGGKGGWAWSSTIDCYGKYPIIVIPERLWAGQSAPGQSDPDRRELILTDMYLCDSDGKPVSETGLPVPYEIYYEDKESGESSNFRVYIGSQKVYDREELKFRYVFKERV